MEYTFTDLADILERLKKKLRLAVIYAGNNRDSGSVAHITPNTRPWKSYEFVAHDIAASCRANGFEHVFVFPENINLLTTLRENNIHFVWINSAGVQGINPMAHAPALLEMAGIPYVGHSSLDTTVLDNKHHFKRECVGHRIPTGRFITWDVARGRFRPRLNSLFKASFRDYDGPFIIKPVSGRASIGVEVVEFDKLSERVGALYEQTHNVVLIEEYFGGPEYCVSVSGPILYRNGVLEHLRRPFAFSELERVFEPDELIFTSMDVKPINDQRFRLLDKNDQKQSDIMRGLRHIARNIYLDLNLRTLMRVDIRADAFGNLFVLEANPKPDLKRGDQNVTNLTTVGLGKHGLGYDDYAYTLIANRLHDLLRTGSEYVRHITELL